MVCRIHQECWHDVEAECLDQLHSSSSGSQVPQGRGNNHPPRSCTLCGRHSRYVQSIISVSSVFIKKPIFCRFRCGGDPHILKKYDKIFVLAEPALFSLLNMKLFFILQNSKVRAVANKFWRVHCEIQNVHCVYLYLILLSINFLGLKKFLGFKELIKII